MIEWGIQIRVRNVSNPISAAVASLIPCLQPDDEREFKTDNDRVLQTTRSLQRHASPDTDDNTVKPSHGTQVASKAVGKKYGLAKEVCCQRCKAFPIHASASILSYPEGRAVSARPADYSMQL